MFLIGCFIHNVARILQIKIHKLTLLMNKIFNIHMTHTTDNEKDRTEIFVRLFTAG